MSDEQKHTEEEQPEAAQADLEVSDEDAAQVEGGFSKVRFDPNADPQGFKIKI